MGGREVSVFWSLQGFAAPPGPTENGTLVKTEYVPRDNLAVLLPAPGIPDTLGAHSHQRSGYSATLHHGQAPGPEGKIHWYLPQVRTGPTVTCTLVPEYPSPFVCCEELILPHRAFKYPSHAAPVPRPELHTYI